ncbi:unnamed protein product [Calypogeia fissa]
MEGASTNAVVSELNIYPVKSCRGISVPAAKLSSTGFDWDRQWMVVNPKGRFLTQRQVPMMALIEASLPIEALDQNWGPLRPDSALCLKAPGMEPLQVLLNPPGPREKVPASVWKWSGHALDEGSTAAEWFSRYFGKPGTRLVRFDAVGATRPTDPDYAVGYKVAFSDGFPILLVSWASLDALNERLPEPLPMNRFRPNIVVKGCDAFAEDLWSKFKIGGNGASFLGVKLCSRCKVTTTNQTTAEVGKEPLESMRSFRLGQLLSPAPQMKGQVYFGQNVVFDSRDGAESTVAVGDEVHVLQQAASVTEVMAKAGA